LRFLHQERVERRGHHNGFPDASNETILTNSLRDLLTDREHEVEAGNREPIRACCALGRTSGRVSKTVEKTTFPDDYRQHRALRKLTLSEQEASELIGITDYIHLYHGNAALLTESLEVIQKTSAVILSALEAPAVEATDEPEPAELAEAS
jgi:hypothetical protein